MTIPGAFGDGGFDRRRYRREVERLLEQIRRLVREIGPLQKAGTRGRELEERRRELERARRRLATLISGRVGQPVRRRCVATAL